MKFRVNSTGKENLKKLNNKKLTIIIKYSKYKVPFLPKDLIFINSPDTLYATDSNMKRNIKL